MRVYLLNPPYIENFVRCGRWQGAVARGGTLYYPIWLAYAAGALEVEGHIVRLIDAIARKWGFREVSEDAIKFKPDVIVVDSNFSSLNNDINMAKRIGIAANARTILVGPPASQFSERILTEGVDFVAQFEYEYTLRELLRGIEDETPLNHIDGISYKIGKSTVNNPRRPFLSSQQLDQLPFVSMIYKKHLNVRDYFLNHSYYPMVQIISSRGCPNQCTFCSWPETLTGREFRSRSIGNFVDEFDYISNELPEIKEVFIEDDSFTIRKQRVLEFCQMMKDRKISLSWSCQSRGTLDYETMRAMKNSGCRLLDVGYESGADQILKNIKKGVTTDQLTRFTRDAKRARLKVLADFVIGFTGETRETAYETIRFIKRIKPDILQIAIASPIPGTLFHKWCQENGYLLQDDMSKSIDEQGFQRCIISYPSLSNFEIEELVNNAVRNYYLNVSYLPIAFKGLLGGNGVDELKLLLRSTRMFIKNLKI